MRSYDFHDVVIKSPYCEVLFQGWKSTTIELQQNGWDLAVEFDPYKQEYLVYISNSETRLCGVSDPFRVDPRASYEIHLIHINNVSHNPQHKVYYAQPPRSFEASSGIKPFDAIPQVVEQPRMADILENGVFRLKEKESVLIEQADMDVVEMLEAIVKKQAPKQAELRSNRKFTENDQSQGLILLA